MEWRVWQKMFVIVCSMFNADCIFEKSLDISQLFNPGLSYLREVRLKVFRYFVVHFEFLGYLRSKSKALILPSLQPTLRPPPQYTFHFPLGDRSAGVTTLVKTSNLVLRTSQSHTANHQSTRIRRSDFAILIPESGNG